MKLIPNYPMWFSGFMLLGPFLLVSSAFFRDRDYIWIGQVVGALMVAVSFFYLSKRLHEHMEEVASLKQTVSSRAEVPQQDSE